MSESEHLADALTGLLLEVENGWFLPVFGALEGLSAQQAAQAPAEKFNSPWSIVRHMTYWMQVILLRLRGEDPAAVLGEDWLPLPEPASESAWAADKEQLKQVTLQLARTVRAWDDAAIETPHHTTGHSRRQVIQGVIGHNCYHTNEIICSRHMLGYWLDQT